MRQSAGEPDSFRVRGGNNYLTNHRKWIDLSAALLIVIAGLFSTLDSFLVNNHEMIPLMAGLAILFLNHSREEPLRLAYLLLLLLSMRIYLFGDERYEAVSYTHLTLPTNREV